VTDQDYIGRSVLGHQSPDLGKDPVRCLLVRVRKPGVDLDSIREVWKEGRIWGNEVDAKVGMNGQKLLRIGSLMSNHNRGLRGPKSNKN